MMEPMESCVPPGFRFHPTDEELVGYYLRKKVASQKIDLDVIREIDLYRIEPWDLQERCRIGYEEQNEWYFFSHKDKKYPTGTRTNRATVAGFWKATGRDKAVYDKTKLIGMRKTLVFYKGRAPNGQKTDWIMHEYRLESDENAPPQEEGWVVCRAFKKKSNNGQTKTIIEGWDSSGTSFFYDETSSGMDYVAARQPHHHHNFMAPISLLCKKEIASELADNNNSINNSSMSFMHTTLSSSVDEFVQQLPQLESPSLPLIKRPTTLSSLISHNNNNNHLLLGEDDDHQNNSRLQVNNNKRVTSTNTTTDWRALDKFVASQLSQEEENHGGFETQEALLLLQNNNNNNDEGGNKFMTTFLNGSCTSNSDCDIGICVFDK